jgi:organic radical activating enzyme
VVRSHAGEPNNARFVYRLGHHPFTVGRGVRFPYRVPYNKYPVLKLDRVEFYITHVCNLNCPNCNRFNNFAFSGHQSWHEYREQYQQWAKILDVREIGILGGEPLLNPEFPAWLDGIAELWPRAQIQIITNGTQWNRWDNFYQLVDQYQGRVSINVSGHSQDNCVQDHEKITSWLHGEVKQKINSAIDYNNAIWQKCYNDIRDTSWPDCPSPQDFDLLPMRIQTECREQHRVCPEVWETEIYSTEYTDSNGVTVEYTPSWVFNTTTVVHNAETGQLRLHRSDPDQAMEICYFKKCHHFIRGKLYKCGPVGILPDFIQQFAVDITDKERDLINNYQPAQYNWDQTSLETFVQDLRDAKSIAQCTFCPEKFVPLKFNASNKKAKVIKLKQIN